MQSEQFERIHDFWTRRQQLTQGELGEFYQRVIAALTPCRPREAASLGDSLADLRHQFFIEKVLNSDSEAAPHHVGALFLYFKRFIIDQLRKQRDDDDADAQDGCDLQAPDAYAEPLRDYRLTPASVRAAADVFVTSLPRDLILLLRHCGCGGMPVKELAEQIASAHYHGGKLGLVHKQKGDVISAARQIVAPAHRATLLGSWVLTLLKLRVGDALAARDLQAAQIVLDILCVAALSLHMDPAPTPPNTDERPPA
ncbi:hypothetical protein O0880_17820 [Janthinobacterium sp. SUN118]|uniref:hypothetical protein n=1 Tax=Janthinobacterium sp. SUN118 TaxID=3004100 RepID=UPI0025AFA74E|nr:hypothetical protein [Janthinobacterium sp. SUN118]MDN2711281.1 hypothetical protein [Janthinobacterium sp. SUN118]